MNKNYCKILSFSLLLLFFAAFTSCSTKQKLSKKPLKEYGVNHLIREVEKNDFDFEQFQAKMSINVDNNGSNINLKGQLRMDKDSVVWASLSLGLGLELARAKITEDSVFLIKRTDKTFMTEDIKSLKTKLPEIITLDFIQSILVGNNIHINKGEDAEVKIENDSYILTINDKDMNVIQTVRISPENFKILSYEVKELKVGGKKIQMEYEDFIFVGERLIPSRIRCIIDGKQDIEINYSNIVIDNKLEYPFNIPSKYERVKKW